MRIISDCVRCMDMVDVGTAGVWNAPTISVMVGWRLVVCAGASCGVSAVFCLLRGAVVGALVPFAFAAGVARGLRVFFSLGFSSGPGLPSGPNTFFFR